MDQLYLRELEKRCIQEEPPGCAAACPLHLDGRALAERAACGDWSGAWKVLLKTMPFPGILGRICDGPCQGGCKRAQAGGAVNLPGLERACLDHSPPPRTSLPLPPKEEPVAVIGAGLAGLTAAWDLARKGYQVTIREPGPALASRLRRELAGRVPDDAVEEELNLLTRLKVEVELNAPVTDKGFLDRCLKEYRAVFLSLDVLDPAPWPLKSDSQGNPLVSSPDQAALQEGVFAGGLDRPGGPSPVWQAAQGRWGAASLDRFVQGVSLAAGRDRDLPFETLLFTSLKGVEPLPVTPASGESGYTQEEALQEAMRCLQCACLECVKVCPYLKSYQAYPKKYARQIYNNLSIVLGDHGANRMINSCSLCGLCEQVCPQNFAMQDLCLTARQTMAARGKMPPSAHEFALLDMEFSQGPEFRLARHQPGHNKSAHVFFPGCQLAGSAPGQVAQVYDYLCESLPGGVGLMLGCCGAPAHWAGQEGKTAQVLADWQEDWQSLGSPPVIAACSTCFKLLGELADQAEVLSLWPILEKTGPPQVRDRPGEQVAIHDPCTTRNLPELQESARRLAAQAGVALAELDLGRDLTQCCGFGGLMENANPDLAGEVIRDRAGQSRLDYLTYCAVCRELLAGTGKRTWHILDLYFPEPGGINPGDRPRTGWSARRENRARLKDGLLRQLWQEETPRMEEHRGVKLIMTPEVAQLLERRRILEEDIQKVIHEAEQGGPKLTHPRTGHFLAWFRPYKAVFWVEYSPSGEGYEIHRAYSHRMEVKAK